MRPAGVLHVSELVVIRPSEPLASFIADRGYLPKGVPLLKRVLALPGQTVCRVGRTITIDAIAMGDALEADRRGRPLPVWQGCLAIAPGQIFVMNSQSADSFDGRYFGSLPASPIIGRADPLWTHDEDRPCRQPAQDTLGTDPFDAHDNIVAGTAYLREFHDRYGNPGFLAADNAGPARYEAHLAIGQPLPDETRAYVNLLAPLTAVDRAGDGAVLAVAVRSWTEAPLFVVQTDGSPTASRPSSAVQYERRSVAAAVIDLTGLAPRSGGLFVPTSRRNPVP